MGQLPAAYALTATGSSAAVSRRPRIPNANASGSTTLPSDVTEEMAIASGLPRPKIWIVPDPDPNAFATGHDAATASVAVTEGLLNLLSRDELQAVVAHEMAHIRNLDIRLMTLLAGMVGAIALMSDGMGRMLGRGAIRRVRTSRGERPR